MIIDTSKEQVFFTSDTHFGHKNIIKYCNRPFSSAEEMDAALIENWNKRVQKDDWVFHLGDFCFIHDREKQKELVAKLNGRIFFIWGNHDKHLHARLFHGVSACPLYETDFLIGGQQKKFVLCHYAMRVWNKSHHGAIHLYGHSHNSLPDDLNALSMDVGTDCNNYTPFSMDEVLAVMAGRTFKPVDHHGM